MRKWAESVNIEITSKIEDSQFENKFFNARFLTANDNESKSAAQNLCSYLYSQQH